MCSGLSKSVYSLQPQSAGLVSRESHLFHFDGRGINQRLCICWLYYAVSFLSFFFLKGLEGNFPWSGFMTPVTRVRKPGTGRCFRAPQLGTVCLTHTAGHIHVPLAACSHSHLLGWHRAHSQAGSSLPLGSGAREVGWQLASSRAQRVPGFALPDVALRPSSPGALHSGRPLRQQLSASSSTSSSSSSSTSAACVFIAGQARCQRALHVLSLS